MYYDYSILQIKECIFDRILKWIKHTCNRVMLIITVFSANCMASVNENASSISSANLREKGGTDKKLRNFCPMADPSVRWSILTLKPSDACARITQFVYGTCHLRMHGNARLSGHRYVYTPIVRIEIYKCIRYQYCDDVINMSILFCLPD